MMDSNELPPPYEKESPFRLVTKYDLLNAAISCAVIIGIAFVLGVFFEIENMTILKLIIPIAIIGTVLERIIRKKLLSKYVK